MGMIFDKKLLLLIGAFLSIFRKLCSVNRYP